MRGTGRLQHTLVVNLRRFSSLFFIPIKPNPLQNPPPLSPPLGFRTLSSSSFSTTTITTISVKQNAPKQPNIDSTILEHFQRRKLKGTTKTPPTKTPESPPQISSHGMESEDGGPTKADASFLSFKQLGLCEELIEAVKDMGVLVPSEIQCVGIPAVLEGKSVVLTSHSDSSGTLTYLLPLIQLLRQDVKLLGSKPKHPRALVLCATDEHCDEVFRIAKVISHHRQLKSAKESCCDGSNSQDHASDVSIGLLVGTPDEVLQLIQDGNVVPDEIKYLVLDEVDAMHDHGFGADIQKVLSPLKEIALKSNDQGLQTVLVTSIMTKMLHEHLSSFVQRLESNHEGEVAAMLLEVDQKEVVHLIESPDALKQRVAEAMDSLHVATPGS